ncbi:MAG TPA: hypothetical protein VEL74_14030 [Thermoanaerobaculia bacterium]|nr:hypothetical protein [Thermoanaerobaculia bacterium]
MKKTLRCFALAGVIGMSAWLSFPATAHAFISCEEYEDERFCYDPSGTHWLCTWASTGTPGLCVCDFGRWFCW